MEFCFHVYNSLAGTGAAMALSRIAGPLETPPVILCVGSDLSVGDSLGPLVGTMLRREKISAYVYGCLRAPVTAKEIKYLKSFLSETHPGAKIVAVDAAVGESSELGLVKITDNPLRPGSGANKRLGEIGDLSVLGIVAEKGAFPYASLNLTRLHTVYAMAETIKEGIEGYLGRCLRSGERFSQTCL